MSQPMVRAVEQPASGPSGAERITQRQIRGSSLLLLGRLMALAAKLIAQVVLVRHLAMAEYGSWAYGLSIVALLGGFAHLSLDRAVTRFTAIYHERGEYDRFFGVIAMVAAVVVLTGTLFVGGAYALQDQLALLLRQPEALVALLLVLVLLVPLEALDSLLVALLASLGATRAIFVRRYVVAPAVQLGAVLLVVLLDASIAALAWAYVAGAAFGVGMSAWLLLVLFREQGLLGQFRTHGIRVPARELVQFSVPLMTSDWLAAMIESLGTLALGYLYSTQDVALFRIVFPLALLNRIVIQSFGTLYEPAVSRLFARRDTHGIADIYWATTLWIAVLSFPIFAVTFALATPLTVLLYGDRYAAAGPLLAILAVGHYLQSVSGFNGMTIKAVGRVRSLVVINLLALVVNVLVTLLLVPPFGAVGAAVSLTLTLLIHNVFKQIGLHAATGIALPDPQLGRAFAAVAIAVVILAALLAMGPAPLPVAILTVASAILLVVAQARRSLRIAEVFPELRRIPYLRLLLA